MGEGEDADRLGAIGQCVDVPVDLGLPWPAVNDNDVLDVRVEPAALTLTPGQEVKLAVTVQRRKDFTQNVILDVPLRHLERPFNNPLPPGVTVVDTKSKTMLRGTETQGHIVLKVAPDAAPVENVPVSVAAYVSINFVVKVGYSSAVIPVTIQKGN